MEMASGGRVCAVYGWTVNDGCIDERPGTLLSGLVDARVNVPVLGSGLANPVFGLKFNDLMGDGELSLPCAAFRSKAAPLRRDEDEDVDIRPLLLEAEGLEPLDRLVLL
eukprot:CAMPEP_0194503476 /NCGR_PEP_ID=MMETSP0253-20130528/28401_1 /TAXON_ID=2966 /ORGANISM="Noctiluca scintillans" /LENGTH=108 /DNA_ID=CAMNT_0039345763 /DNA_START=214 /DNA_END=540 /DNA_ORIENTATION=-